MPKVSVIIPNYNHAPFLRERIDSVLNQTYGDIEVILLDDCSTDNSVSVLESYRSNPKVSAVVLNTENSGSTFKQWQKGFDLAKGEFIWIAESDDFADTDFLAEALKELDADENRVLSYADSEMVDKDSQPLPIDWDKYGSTENQTYESDFFFKKVLLWHNCLYNASAIVFRRSAIEGIDGGYKSMRYCGDWYFWSEIVRQGKVVRIRRKLNHFRQHSLKVSPNAEREGLQFTEGFVVATHILNTIKAGPWLKLACAGNQYKRIGWFNGLSAEKKAELVELLKRHFSINGTSLALVVAKIHKLLFKTW